MQKAQLEALLGRTARGELRPCDRRTAAAPDKPSVRWALTFALISTGKVDRGGARSGRRQETRAE